MRIIEIYHSTRLHSVEESQYLSSDLSLSGIIVIHDSLVGSKDNVSELSGGEDLNEEFLEVLELNIESWGNDSTFVESSVKFDDDLSGSLVINDLEVIDISMLLHLSEELDDDL